MSTPNPEASDGVGVGIEIKDDGHTVIDTAAVGGHMTSSQPSGEQPDQEQQQQQQQQQDANGTFVNEGR
jgi:hypothetical protein